VTNSDSQFPETHASLLLQLQNSGNQEAWLEFVSIYRPIIYRLARRRGLQDADSQAAPPNQWLEAKQMLQPSEFDQASTAEFSAGAHGECEARQSSMVKSVLAGLSPTDDPHRLGRLGGYEISGVIGVGGMGVVLKAFDPTLDRVIAIKVLAPHLAHSVTARKRFAREAKAAAAVLHPNVIPIYCVSSHDPIPYLVMAYIRGGSLQKRLDREGPLPTVEILRIGAQIAAGLAAAHEQGLVHRDIKPENILLDEGVERVTLTDFGLARAVDDASVTREGTIAGTPQYMSPEQSRGESVDQKSDLFSLGSVLYALCTGRPPYRADNSYGVMRRIIDEAPVPVRDLNPEIPEWLAAIVVRLMAKDKAERFATAGEVHKLLEACLSHTQQPQIVPLPEIPGLGTPLVPRPFFSSPLGRIGVIVMSLAASVAILAAVTFSQVNRPSLTEPGTEPPAASIETKNTRNPVAASRLSIESQENEGVNESGERGKYTWKLTGESVESLTVRVLHIENGVTRVVNETVYQGRTQGEQRFEVELKLKDLREPMPFPGKMLIPTLAVSVNGRQAKAGTGERVFFPGDFQGHFESTGGPVVRDEVLGWLAHDLKEREVNDSLESIVEASRKGTTFLVTTVDWTGNDQATAENVADDANNIQGTWQVTSVESEGELIMEDGLHELQHVFAGHELIQVVGKKKKQAEFKLDPTASPKTIEIVSKGEKALGIYELQGNTLRLCLAQDLQPRPTNFDSKNGRTIATFKRIVDRATDQGGKGYSLEEVTIGKTELKSERQLEIKFETLVETMWYCPGANGERGEQGLELTFPRVPYKNKADVDYPASYEKESRARTITVDPKNKPVFIRFGEKREKIWDPEDNAQKSGLNKLADVRRLLEQGCDSATMPKGLVVRVCACMGAAIDRKTQSLVEKWEFTPTEVHRVKTETKDGKAIYTRLESRKCDTAKLCQLLLDGKALEIDARKGTGPDAILVGTVYQRGSRSIEVEWNGATLLELGETNGPILHVYRETDAKAFGELYERLAIQARVLFETDGGK
jgi:uncharacterized protein (TIGR03067 family)